MNRPIIDMIGYQLISTINNSDVMAMCEHARKHHNGHERIFEFNSYDMMQAMIYGLIMGVQQERARRKHRQEKVNHDEQ